MAKTTKSEAEEKSDVMMYGAAAMAAQVPDFMREEKSEGGEHLSKYIVPPRLKVIQPTRKDDAYNEFDEGDVVLVPAKQRLVKKEEPFLFTPIFGYPEFLTLNPLELSTLPMIRASSLDPKSDIALKAYNRETRFEKCPEDPRYQIRHVEVLVFLCYLHNMSAGDPQATAITFSKGEIGVGSSLAAMLQARGKPWYGCVFEAKVPKEKRKNTKGQWYGLNVYNPTMPGSSPFVQDRNLYEALRELHNKFKEAHAANLVAVRHDDERDDEVGPSSEDQAKY